MRRRLDRVWHVIENSELDISDATSRIREHRERQEKLEIAAEEARALLSERRAVLDNVDTIAAFAEDMSEFLMTSEITESRAFIKSFVKEIKVKPGKATVYYTLPEPAVPEGYTAESYLRRLCSEAALRRYGFMSEKVEERL